MEGLARKTYRTNSSKRNIMETHTINYTDVHHKFKLNGFHLGKDDLCRVAYSFIKEGADFEKPVGNFLLDWFDDRDYIEMDTSGSTGLPKRIRVKKQAMVNSALATGAFFDLMEGDKVLHCLPAKYVAGKMMFVRGFVLGLDIDFVAPSAKPLKSCDTQYAFSAMVPLQAQNSIADLKWIKKLIVGGAKISAQLEADLIASGTACFETFGMTETVSHIAAKPVGDAVFQTMSNIEVSADERGCLVISAPDISNEKIVSNDLVQVHTPNTFTWLGRIDNVINSGGIKLSPELIEEKLAPKFIRRFFVAGLPDDELGQRLVLVVEGEPYELSEDTFKKLDKYEKPKEIIFKPIFKETGNGKIIRQDSLNA